MSFSHFVSRHFKLWLIKLKTIKICMANGVYLSIIHERNYKHGTKRILNQCFYWSNWIHLKMFEYLLQPKIYKQEQSEASIRIFRTILIDWKMKTTKFRSSFWSCHRSYVTLHIWAVRMPTTQPKTKLLYFIVIEC